MNRSLALLVLCQGLFLTNNVAFIAINGLVGLALAPRGWMATLPVMAYVVGSAVAAPLVARTQRRWGRRASFQIGLAVAAASALACAAAAGGRSFWLLCAATAVAGFYNANATLYRFAAAELVAPAWREKAVSLLMAGGLLGAVLGPNLAAQARGWLDAPFAGAYLALAVVALAGMAAMSQVGFPALPAPADGAARPAGRPLGEIARQPAFMVAALVGALSYGVMNLLMAATPLAMQVCGLPFSDAATVLQWHVVGMFAPGFFTGHAIRRWGALAVMAAGLALVLACIATALSGVELWRFATALTLLGVGWNFLFTASTTLALTTYRPEEKDRAQALLNQAIFVTLAVSALSSGVLVTSSGWQWLNAGSLVPALAIAGALAWLWRLQRGGRLPGTALQKR